MTQAEAKAGGLEAAIRAGVTAVEASVGAKQFVERFQHNGDGQVDALTVRKLPRAAVLSTLSSPAGMVRSAWSCPGAHPRHLRPEIYLMLTPRCIRSSRAVHSQRSRRARGRSRRAWCHRSALDQTCTELPN
jgi:hypothetical protein